MISLPFAQQFKQWVKGNGVELSEYDRGFITALNDQKQGTITQGMDFKTIYADYDKVSTATKQLAENNKYLGRTFTDLGKGIGDLGNKSSSLGTRFIKLGKSLGSSLISGLMSAGVMIAVNALVSGIAKTIDQAINGKKYMREASAKFTDAYIGNKNDLESLTSKYEELNDKLHNTALSTDEYKQVKEQLSGVQDQIIDKFGKEAEGIDLVNGKYEDQLAILQNISQQEAENYVHANALNIDADREKIGGQKIVNGLKGFDALNPATDQQFINLLSKYQEFEVESIGAGLISYVNKNNKMTIKEQYDLINALMSDIDKTYGNNKNATVQAFYDNLAKSLNDLDMEGYNKSQNAVDTYALGQVLQNSQYAKSYRELTDAVNDYNEALESGEGVEEAKKNLDSVEQRYNKVTAAISEDAKIVRDDLFEGISDNEIEYSLKLKIDSQDTEITSLLEQLKDSTDEDLLDVNWADNITTPFEELCEVLGVSQEEVQALINLLLELGYIQSGAEKQNKQNLKDRLGYKAINNPYVTDTNQAQKISQQANTNTRIDDFINGISSEEVTMMLNTDFSKLRVDATLEEMLAYARQQNLTIELEPQVNPIESLDAIKSTLNNFDAIDVAITKGEYVDADAVQKLFGNPDDKRNQDGTFEDINNGTKSLERFQKVITELPDDTEAQQKALDRLATEYLDQSDLMKNLTKANAKYVKQQLTEMGITNAEVYVNSRLNEGVQELAKNLISLANAYDDNIGYLDEQYQGSKQYEEALGNIKNSVAELFTYYAQGEDGEFQLQTPELSDEFILSQLDNIKNAAYGSEEALWSLRQAAAQEIIANIVADANLDPNAASELYNEINAIVSSIKPEDLVVGTYLDDNPMIQGLNNLIDASKITANGMNAILASVGVEPEIEGYKTLKMMATTSSGNTTADFYAQQAYQNVIGSVSVPSIRYKVASKGAPSASYVSPTGGKSSGGGGGGGGGGGSDKESENEYDWIAVGIQRCQEAIERLNKVETNVYTDWSKRNKALGDEMTQTAKKISYLQAAYQGYMDAANNVGLSEDYKKKVQEGKIQIETVTDEKLKEKIDKYKSYYESAMSAKDAIDDLNISLSELAKKKFDNIVTQFEEINSLTENIISQIDSAITLTTTKGYLVGKSFYQSQLTQEQKLYNSLQQEKQKLVDELNNAVTSGKVTKESEAWYEMYNKIQDVTKAITESEIKMEEYKNSIREVDWTMFDMMQEKLSDINTELEFLSKLLEGKELTDGKANKGLSKYGLSQMGAMASEYNTYMQQAQNYKEEIAKIDKDIKNDPNNQTLLKRRQELLKAQQDSISAAQDEKKAMIDLARSGYDAILDALQETIDKRKELLQTEKDLYDYQQTVADQTKAITDIQKQLSVYSLDNTEESRKKVQDLKNQLKAAQRELDNTQRDKQIDDQTNALDKLYDNYSELIDKKFEDTDKLFSELIKDVNTNSSVIKTTIQGVAKDVDYKLSQSVGSLINSNGVIVSDFHGSFTTYATNMQNMMQDVKDEMNRMANVYENQGNNSQTSTENIELLILNGEEIKNSELGEISEVYIKKKQQTGVLKGTPLNAKGYATGTKHLKNGFAWTNEYGESELIRTSDGALLTPVGNGGTVFTSEMSDVLWNFASNPQAFIQGSTVPYTSVTPRVTGGQLYVENMVLPDVTKPEDFANRFVSTLQSNPNMVKSIQSVTTDLVAGKSIKKLNRF